MARRWYAIQTYAGHENKVRDRLERIIANDSSEEKAISGVLIPTEEAFELKKGKKVKVIRRLYPGYVLVEMDLTEETLATINSVQGIIKFLGTDRRPEAITPVEIDKILRRMEQAKAQPLPDEIPFRIGDLVEVIDGPFNDFSGSVEDIFPEKGKVRVVVSLFGRPTPIELDYVQLKAL